MAKISKANNHKICTRCIMDTSASDITFDENGVCSYCSRFLERSSNILFREEAERDGERDAFLNEVKSSGKGKQYDCVIGLSGGADSSWSLYQAVQHGLRPLAVHMDNGWDSELAQQNIENLVRKLGVDLYTHVIDWDEYRKLQQAFFDADVIDVELLYDNAMFAVNYQMASKYSVKYILAGTNQSTEGMAMPPYWNWFKYDKKNINALWKRFGSESSIRTFPAIGSLDFVYYFIVRGIRWVSFLDYFDYNKTSAMNILHENLGYRPYPYKHYESIFTRFYQGFLLPRKFGVDKRRLHLSTLIISGQMSRDEAIRLMEQSPYAREKDLEHDIEYFLKKMKWTNAQLEDYLERPEKPHGIYGSEKRVWDTMAKVWFYFKGKR